MKKMTKATCRAAGLAALALMASCSGKGNMASMMGGSGEAPELAVMTVENGTSDLSHAYAATIKGKVDVDVRPLVSGFVTKVHVDEGQYVKAGQPLFTLDQVTFQAAVEQAQAAVNSAQTAVSTAQLTADNKKLLFDKNIISDYEYQLAVNQLNTAKAQLANANAALTSARKNLSYTVVTAPVSGYVGTIPNREGTLASPSMQQPLTTVSDNSEVYAYFALTEKDILEMTEGKGTLSQAIAKMPKVELKLADGSIYPLEGTVATVSGVIDASTGSTTVRARFANPDGLLRSGSTGQILVPNRIENVIMVPQSATYEVQDRRFVYVLNDSNKTVSTAISVSPLNDGRNFVVTEGLTPGQRVVVEGVGTKVQPGMEVKPKAATAAAAEATAE